MLSCWILTINQIFNLYLFDQNLFYDERIYFFSCVLITGAISIFFKAPNKSYHLFNKELVKYKNQYLSKYILFLFTFLTFGISGFFGSVIQFILKSLLFISPIMISGVYYLFSKKKIFPIIFFFISFLFYTSIMFNRTGYLLVQLYFLLQYLLIINLRLNLKNINFLLVSIILILITLIFADIYKGSETKNFIEFVGKFRLVELVNYFSESRYKINPTHNLYDYFSIIDALTDDRKEIGGNIFTQFGSIFQPRFFFPDKPVTNISELNYMQGTHSSTLFAAIFIESTYNLGLFGVLIYHFLILLIGNLMLKSVSIVRNELLFNFFSLNYFFYIIHMYTLIRGPGIHFISYFFICFIIMLFYLLRSKK